MGGRALTQRNACPLVLQTGSQNLKLLLPVTSCLLVRSGCGARPCPTGAAAWFKTLASSHRQATCYQCPLEQERQRHSVRYCVSERGRLSRDSWSIPSGSPGAGNHPRTAFHLACPDPVAGPFAVVNALSVMRASSKSALVHEQSLVCSKQSQTKNRPQTFPNNACASCVSYASRPSEYQGDLLVK